MPGQTVNRLCGSGLQAVASAAQAIRSGEGETFIAGGVESMTRAPYVMLKASEPWSRKAPETADTTVGWRFVNPRMKKEWTISLGETAEVVAERYGTVPASPPLRLTIRACLDDRCRGCGLPVYRCESEDGQILSLCAGHLRPPN